MKLILSEIKNIGKNLAILSYIPSKNCNATVITKIDKAPTVFLKTKPAKHSKIIKNILLKIFQISKLGLKPLLQVISQHFL